jgi:serine/threonine protein phosphatase 1
MRYAIGDIHGCFKTLHNLLEKVIKIEDNDELFFLGDYIDRGPDSKSVLDYLIKLKKNGIKTTLLKGNHEDLMIKALRNYEDFILWLQNGAKATLSSFGIQISTAIEWRKTQQIPDKYIKLIAGTLFFTELDDYLLVHAGFNFSLPAPYQDHHSMIWIRGFTPDKHFTNKKIIVHAHTPVPFDTIMDSANNVASPIINVDGGCVYTNRQGMGNLVALSLDTREIFNQKNIDQ